MQRRIYNKSGECIMHSIDTEKCVKHLASLLWNKYVLKAHEIIRVKKIVHDNDGTIRFYFSNGTMEEYSDLPITWGHLYFGGE